VRGKRKRKEFFSYTFKAGILLKTNNGEKTTPLCGPLLPPRGEIL
jgi:hypothetical protein